MKCCANVYFNRQCVAKKVIPNYVNIKIPQISPATNTTQKMVHTIRLKDEILIHEKRKTKYNCTEYTYKPHKNGDTHGTPFLTPYMAV